MSNMAVAQTKEELRQQLMDLAGYMLASIRALYREPHNYGPMRMIDALDKVLQLLQSAGVADETVNEAMAMVRERRPAMMSDPDGFIAAVDSALHKLVQATMWELDESRSSAPD